MGKRVFVSGAATPLTLLIGGSRIVLGANWTTDVIGGWAFGASWVLLWLLLARQVLSRSQAAR